MFDTLGIDIGAESVKMAVVSGGKVRRTAEVTYPEEYFSDGWVTDPSRMGLVLRDAMRETKIRTRKAAMQLPGDASYVHTTTMPIMNAKQLQLNLRFAFTDYITDSLDHYAYDYAMLDTPKQLRAALSAPPPEEGGEPTMDFLAVAAPLNLLSQVRRTLEGAKLRLTKAAPPECSCVALIRSIHGGADTGQEYCVLDLGARAIRLYIFRGERHIVTRSLETGMRAFVNPITQYYRVRREDAMTLYRENKENCQYLQGCLDVGEDIAHELMRTLNFYRFSHQESSVEDVWLIGGGAGSAPLAEAIGRATEMRVHAAEELTPGGRDIQDCFRFALAVGAALC